MLDVLANRLYRRLFSAQIVALLGTGILTVALGLLAYDLAGEKAGAVLGTALAIKMIAYVGLAPVASAVTAHWPRKQVLVGMDLLRAAVALCLPIVTQVWQIYVMIFLLQAASATFTPTFQALIPDILPDEKDYTKALSLSRLAYDLENLISPTLAGLALLVMSYHWLFAGTVAGFAFSAILVVGTALPLPVADAKQRPFLERVTRGSRIYLATPRLRGLLSLNLAAAAGGAMVIVNTVVIVRAGYQGSESDVAMALGAFGCGSMLAALTLPSLLERLRDRAVMTPAALGMTILLLALGGEWMVGIKPPWTVLLLLWFGLGLFYSTVLTPSGRLLRRSAGEHDRPALFAAQFALSHACWLLTYPLAGWIGERAGMGGAFTALGLCAALGVLAAWLLWPADDPEIIEHVHRDLPPGHPHLGDAIHEGDVWRHRHAFVIDDEHRAWPTQG
jgi:MFS family permease